MSASTSFINRRLQHETEKILRSKLDMSGSANQQLLSQLKFPSLCLLSLDSLDPSFHTHLCRRGQTSKHLMSTCNSAEYRVHSPQASRPVHAHVPLPSGMVCIGGQSLVLLRTVPSSTPYHIASLVLLALRREASITRSPAINFIHKIAVLIQALNHESEKEKGISRRGFIIAR